LDLLRHGHVALGDPHITPGYVGTDLRRALFEDFEATGGERDDRTFTRERGRDPAPDAGTAPGDEGVRAAERAPGVTFVHVAGRLRGFCSLDSALHGREPASPTTERRSER